MKIFRKTLSPILDTLFPDFCLLCAEHPVAKWGLCADCLNNIIGSDARRCIRCAACIGAFETEAPCTACRKTVLHFDQAIALGSYTGTLQRLICRYKYLPDYRLCRPIRELIKNHLPELFPADLIVPVPLHWKRKMSRGFNQAESIAAAAAQKLGIPYTPRQLYRSRSTLHQAGLSRTARVRNVKDAFSVTPRLRKQLSGRHVIVVDDVLSTGATCSNCARILKKNGAASVTAVVLAR